MELDSDSSHPTTYEYLRMPFGLRNASQAFQRHIDQVLDDMTGVVAYVDDVIIGSTDAITPKKDEAEDSRPTRVRRKPAYLHHYVAPFTTTCHAVTADWDLPSQAPIS